MTATKSRAPEIDPSGFAPLTHVAIDSEFMRAQVKHSGRTPALPAMADAERLAILGEEFGEVCSSLTYDKSRGDLARELIQLATMALAWAEYEQMKALSTGQTRS